MIKRLFRRRPQLSGEQQLPDPRTPWPEQPVPEDPVAAAAEFWQRWHELLPDISAALGEGDLHRIEPALCAAVAKVHPDLQVSLERGRHALYALVVSGAEDPALRPYTDAWKAAAPADDALWEYHDSVPPVPDPDEVVVNLGAHRLALADVRIAAHIDDTACVVDVAVYHPGLVDLGDEARSAMTFLPLDATLGERLAAQRLRRVETATADPAGSITLPQLRDLVQRLDAGCRCR